MAAAGPPPERLPVRLGEARALTNKVFSSESVTASRFAQKAVMHDEALEEQLARYQKTRDPALMAGIFEQTAPQLWQLAMHLARVPTDADDLLQRTYLAVLESVDRYDPDRPAMGWLVGIMTNCARDARRRAGRQTDPSRLIERLPASPPEQLQTAEEKNLLAEAVASLPELYRQVVELVLEKGIGPGEIAAKLERTPSAVRVQLHRAVALLRKALPTGMALPMVLISVNSTGLTVVREAVHRAALEGAKGKAGVAAGSKLAALALGLSIAGLGGWGLVERSSRERTVVHPLKPGSAALPAAPSTEETTRHAALRGPEELDSPSKPADETDRPPQRSSLSPTSPSPETELTRHFELVFRSAASLSLETLALVPTGTGHLSFNGSRWASEGDAGVEFAPFPADHRALKRLRTAPSSDCILRSIQGIDPGQLEWSSELTFHPWDPLGNIVFVRMGDATGVLARVVHRWRPRGECSESIVRGVWSGGRFPHRGAGESERGVALDPDRLGEDPLGSELGRDFAARLEELNERVEQHANTARRNNPVRGVLSLANPFSVHYARYMNVGATFEFTEGETADREERANPSLLLDLCGHLEVALQVDDRSQAWRIPQGHLAVPPPPQGWKLGASNLPELEEGDVLLIHTLDLSTDRWDLIQILEFDPDKWLIFEWASEVDLTWLEGPLTQAAQYSALRRDRIQVDIKRSPEAATRWAFLDGSKLVEPEEPTGRDLDAPPFPQTTGPCLYRLEDAGARSALKGLANLGYLGSADRGSLEKALRTRGGHIPWGKGFVVDRVEWKAKAKDPAPEDRLRVVLDGEEIVNERALGIARRGEWHGEIELPPGGTSAAFVEASGSLDCDVVLFGHWNHRNDGPRK